MNIKITKTKHTFNDYVLTCKITSGAILSLYNSLLIRQKHEPSPVAEDLLICLKSEIEKNKDIKELLTN